MGPLPHADYVTSTTCRSSRHDALPYEPFDDDDPEPPLGETYLQMAAAGGAAIATSLRVIAEGEHAVVFHSRGRKGPHRHPRGAPAVDARRLRRPDRGGLSAQRARGGARVRVGRSERRRAGGGAGQFAPWKLRSSPETMRVFLDLLRERHGSIDGYLADTGLEPELFDVLRARGSWSAESAPGRRVGSRGTTGGLQGERMDRLGHLEDLVRDRRADPRFCFSSVCTMSHW